MMTQLDFGRLFNNLLENVRVRKYGQQSLFPDMPDDFGICNRLSCGDIYRAIEEFRKSELFTNFQTALQLLQDPEGWQIISELIANPDLIAEFTGDGKSTIAPLSFLKKPTEELPEIDFSIDGGATDYYGQIDENIEYINVPSSANIDIVSGVGDEHETITVDEKIPDIILINKPDTTDPLTKGISNKMTIDRLNRDRYSIQLLLPSTTSSQRSTGVESTTMTMTTTTNDHNLVTRYVIRPNGITVEPSLVRTTHNVDRLINTDRQRLVATTDTIATTRTTTSIKKKTNSIKDDDYYAMYYTD